MGKTIILPDIHIDYKKYAEMDVKMVGDLMDAMRYAGIMVEVDPTEQYMWWTTKEGQNVRIDKMDTSHLKNTINMLKRNGRCSKKHIAPVYRNMREEYCRRLGPAGEVLFGKSVKKR